MAAPTPSLRTLDTIARLAMVAGFVAVLLAQTERGPIELYLAGLWNGPFPLLADLLFGLGLIAFLVARLGYAVARYRRMNLFAWTNSWYWQRPDAPGSSANEAGAAPAADAAAGPAATTPGAPVASDPSAFSRFVSLLRQRKGGWAIRPSKLLGPGRKDGEP